MVESHRLYNCANCHDQVRICTSCDHGNIYCPQCAPEVNRLRVLRNGARYQRTPQGRVNHKIRQQVYDDRLEERIEEKMTHRGPLSESDSIQPCVRPDTEVLNQPPEREEVTHEPEPDPATTGHDADEAATVPPPTGPVRCDFCGQLCSVFARRWPIRRRRANPKTRRQPRPPGYHRRDPRRQASRRQNRRR